MNRYSLAAGAAVFVMTFPALARTFDEPTGFRDLAWGASEKSVRAKLKLTNCGSSDLERDFGTRRCASGPAGSEDGIRIGDVWPETVFYFRDDRFVGWAMSYHANWASEMRSAILDRFGKPELDRQHPGALRWQWPHVEASWTQGAQSEYLRVVVREELLRNEAERAERIKKAGRGF